ncbi:MAG TPA: N-acetyltransferase [Actinomyces sp.]|jgi:predicted GNAT family acetyltransferase|nr:GNAT family N-acetyltransferase [Acidobacteriota bacterium]HHT41721.1 N-acetyltransferase [Actinomyces sp.]
MVEIKYEPKGNRSAAYDGDKLIGESAYTITNGKWNILHTEVHPDYSGQGIGPKLIEKLVEAARENDKLIITTCPYATAQFGRRADWNDVKA